MQCFALAAALVAFSVLGYVIAKEETALVKDQQKFPVGDKRNCQLEKGIYGFEALPGIGWDNLRNLEMGQVMKPTYVTCKTTEDGKYLIPDSTFALPVKETNLQSYAEVFDRWNEYTDMTSRSINAEASFFSFISGSFSHSSEEVKKHQYNDKSSTTRVQIRRHVYTIKAQPDAELSQACKNRFLEIGAHIQTNNTRLASYTAQLFVRDFGTHFTTSVDVGAILAQEDSVKDTFISDYSLRKTEVKAAASASFFGKINLGGGYDSSASHETKTMYTRNLTSSNLKSIGGAGIKKNFTIDEWEAGLANNLVPIDRSGDPIYYVISHNTLPDVPDPIRREIAQYVEEAVDQYYKFNTYKGCTQRDSPNFSFDANIDDGSCAHPLTNFSLGGVYQTCSLVSGSDSSVCTKLSQRNPLTGGFSCPQHYTPVKLVEGTEGSTKKEYKCARRCRSCGFLWLKKCCNEDCQNYYYSTKASYTGYWCAASGSVQQGSGYMFGGVFSSTHTNLLTKSFSCPPHFHGLHLGNDMTVCVGDDVEMGGVYQIPFAGFFSCTSGNPLVLTMPQSKVHKRSLYSFFNQQASDWPHRCPSGYTQHLADLDDGCEIDYCVKANVLSGLSSVKVIRPPFERKPRKNPNSTNLLFIVGSAGTGWIKNETTSEWKRVPMLPLVKLEPSDSELLQAVGGESKDNSKCIGVSSAVGITVGSTAFLGLVIFVVIIVAQHMKGKRPNKKSFVSMENEYGSVDGRHHEAGV